ncbi:MAG: penicillin-binding protein 2 [Robiginitomaculum sp.]
MSNKDDHIQMMNRRSVLIGLGGLCIFNVLASRLYYLQVVRAEDYRVLSDKNQFNFNILLPERGRILDRYGEALAMNKQDFRFVLVPERVQDIDKTLNKIGKILPLSQLSRKRIKNDIRHNAKFIPVLIDEHVEWSVFSALNINLPNIPGLVPVEGKRRSYPNDGVFAHTLGYVGKVGQKPLESDEDSLLRQPSFRIGKTGIEQSFDKVLRGKAGRQKVEVNAIGRIVHEWESDKKEATPGQDVWLTLDAGLQRYSASLFGEESGGVSVIDAKTGELRVLLSMPTFDGNLFVSGLSSSKMKALNADPSRPQFNKVLGGGYPPASTFKMVAMLAALKSGLINPQHPVFCSGKIELGDRIFHCWKRHGHGWMNMHDALQHSCDVYFYEIVQRLGIDRIKSMAEKLGLGQSYDLGINGQIKGIIPNAVWKKANNHGTWRTGDALNAVVGQGYVLATPLQLSVMVARIANGKNAIEPSLIINDNMRSANTLDINPDHIKFVQNAMLSVTERAGGTAYRPGALGIPGVKMAGKTGTGQVRGITTAERAKGVIKNKYLLWKHRDHSIFVGYAPYDNPRFAACVLVEHGGSGAGLAAQYCRKILSKALKDDGMANMGMPIKNEG